MISSCVPLQAVNCVFRFFSSLFFKNMLPHRHRAAHTPTECALHLNTIHLCLNECLWLCVTEGDERKKSDHTFIWLNCQNGGQKKKNCSHSASAETFKSFLNFSWDARFESNCLTLTIRNVNNWVISFWFFLSQLRRRRKNHLLTLARR